MLDRDVTKTETANRYYWTDCSTCSIFNLNWSLAVTANNLLKDLSAGLELKWQNSLISTFSGRPGTSLSRYSRCHRIVGAELVFRLIYHHNHFLYLCHWRTIFSTDPDNGHTLHCTLDIGIQKSSPTIQFRTLFCRIKIANLVDINRSWLYRIFECTNLRWLLLVLLVIISRPV